MPGPVVPALLAFAAGASVVALVTRRLHTRRRQALEELALQSGWSFAPDRIGSEALRAGMFPLLTQVSWVFRGA